MELIHDYQSKWSNRGRWGEFLLFFFAEKIEKKEKVRVS